MLVLEDDPRPVVLLFRVVEQEAAAGALGVTTLGGVLPSRLDRQRSAGPDLAVRMRVRGAHRRAAILEDLHPAVGGTELVGLLGPDVDDPPDLGGVHDREIEIVAG